MCIKYIAKCYFIFTFFVVVEIDNFLLVQSINILSHGFVSERSLHILKGNLMEYI